MKVIIVERAEFKDEEQFLKMLVSWESIGFAEVYGKHTGGPMAYVVMVKEGLK